MFVIVIYLYQVNIFHFYAIGLTVLSIFTLNIGKETFYD